VIGTDATIEDLANGEPWASSTIGETRKYINGLAFKPKDWGDEGMPIIRIQNLTNPTKPLNRTTRQVDPIYVVNPGDILVSWSATLDVFIWNREPSLLNQHIFKVVPDVTVVTKKFLFYTLKKAIAEMIKSEHLHGSTMKHINRGPFLAHKIEVPTLAQQVEIVAELEKQFSRLDEAVANLQRVKANLKRYKASVLKAAVEGRTYELVQATARVCAMNMMLHGIGSEKSVPVVVGDALASDPGERYDVVLANPPFGKKSSTVIVGEDGRTSTEKDTIERDDFWATTSNKQLNFVQHIKTLLKTHGRAAVVLPDNVLFEGGAGETIRKKLLHECDVHTLLRLPTGLFYAQGVKANVLFFEKKSASETPWTKKLWIYDLRTNKHFTLKTSPLRRDDLNEFVELYNAANRNQRQATWSAENPNGRWRVYSFEELIARDKASLDIFWLKDDALADSDNLPAPELIAQEIVNDLEAALEQFRLIAGDFGGEVEDAA
jgi:hypothetical protein